MTEESTPPPRDKSPNKKIDSAIKKLMEEMMKADASPDLLKAKVSVVALAVNWEKIKHSIKDEEEFNPADI
jgi:hypothetical protein